MNFKNYKKDRHGHDVDLLVVSHYYVIHILWQVGASKKSELFMTHLPWLIVGLHEGPRRKKLQN